MQMAHTMIRVSDDAASIAFYETAFGMTIKDRLDFSDFSLIYMTLPGHAFELELTVNKDRAAPYVLGDGYGHLALVVDDLDALHTQMKAKDLPVRDIVEFKPDGQLVGKFFFATDPDGYQIEVLERSGRFA